MSVIPFPDRRCKNRSAPLLISWGVLAPPMGAAVLQTAHDVAGVAGFGWLALGAVSLLASAIFMMTVCFICTVIATCDSLAKDET